MYVTIIYTEVINIVKNRI